MGFSDSTGAESGALGAHKPPSPPADPALARLFEAWPTLPETVRDLIVNPGDSV